MSTKQFNDEAIFNLARKLSNEDRAVYLDQVCGDSRTLRAEVEALLKAHDEGGFLEPGASENQVTVDQPIVERAGSAIGPYKLREQVGEGGMGVVFVAEQERPLRRKVALKIIKPGMDTKDVIARFEAERQALALMDHPNIAKVLDAGSTESGRPYFVMELVRGIPITDYCDQNRLSIRERLELFIEVCQAIQHAHQKGIIHRDVKPTNVLVTLHDGQPVPKVIDFGVAKATNQRLTERTIYTRFAQIIGTPIYMSPEQAELSGLDVDTRSDVYSLGVLLYELLTGTTPFDKARFEKATYDEIRRIVREVEPPKPSTKISSLGATATSVSAHRGTDPRSLCKFVSGDLDVIAMKAIEKDRTRRYDTASGLAADVQRFLNDEPIVARSPSLAYRCSKFARRNRVAVATSALVLGSLVFGVVATGWMAHRANQTLRKLQKASSGEAVAAALAGDQEKAVAALEVARMAGASVTQVTVLKGLISLNNGENDEAVRLAEQALSHDKDDLGAQALLAVACCWAGYDDRWLSALERVRSLTPQSDTDRLLKTFVLMQSDPREALRLVKMAPRIERSPLGVLARGIANAFIALDGQDGRRLDKALTDFDYAQFLSHDSVCSLGWRTFMLAAAIELARQQGRHDDIVRYTIEGRALAEKLEAFPSNPGCNFDRWLFFRAVGDDKAAMDAVHNLGRHPGTFSWFLAADCLRRNSEAAAADEFDRAMVQEHKKSTYVRLARAHLVRGLPGGEQAVHELVDDLLDDPYPFIRAGAVLALCLVCTPEDVQGQARKVLMPALRDFDRHGGAAACDFLAGRLSEPELLRKAEESADAKATAHFTIAMMRLAASKRDEAREHFKIAVATNTVGAFNYEWARAYLARMDADPAWPSWIRDKNAK